MCAAAETASGSSKVFQPHKKRLQTQKIRIICDDLSRCAAQDRRKTRAPVRASVVSWRSEVRGQPTASSRRNKNHKHLNSAHLRALRPSGETADVFYKSGPVNAPTPPTVGPRRAAPPRARPGCFARWLSAEKWGSETGASSRGKPGCVWAARPGPEPRRAWV